MGMSTHVIGFKPPDAKWQLMFKVWNSCVAAGVKIPDDVSNYFDGVEPDPSGVETNLPVEPWRDDSREGYELNVADIPKGVSKIRFYNSW